MGALAHRAELLERLVLVMGHARRIADEQGEEDERARRQRGHPLQQLVERQVVEPGEAYAVVEGLERLLKDRRPEPLERGGPDHDGDVVRVGRQLQDVLDQAREVERLADEGGVALERVVRQRAPVHAGVDDGRPWKETVPILHHEAASRRSDRHHQIGLPLRETREQELDERALHVRLRVAGHVQGDLVHVDAPPQLLGQRGLEGGRVRRERGRRAPEGVDDEDALGLRLRPGGGTGSEHQEEEPER